MSRSKKDITLSNIKAENRKLRQGILDARIAIEEFKKTVGAPPRKIRKRIVT